MGKMIDDDKEVQSTRHKITYKFVLYSTGNIDSTL